MHAEQHRRRLNELGDQQIRYRTNPRGAPQVVHVDNDYEMRPSVRQLLQVAERVLGSRAR